MLTISRGVSGQNLTGGPATRNADAATVPDGAALYDPQVNTPISNDTFTESTTTGAIQVIEPNSTQFCVTHGSNWTRVPVLHAARCLGPAALLGGSAPSPPGAVNSAFVVNTHILVPTQLVEASSQPTPKRVSQPGVPTQNFIKVL